MGQKSMTGSSVSVLIPHFITEVSRLIVIKGIERTLYHLLW